MAIKSKNQVRRRVARKNIKPQFDKYTFYTQAVQSPETDVDFLRKTYKSLKGTNAETLREDFCGTFLLSSTWVRSKAQHKAWAVDIDPEPLEYGKTNYYSKMSLQAQKRLRILECNVLTGHLPEADLVAALNFSYFCFKKRDICNT